MAEIVNGSANGNAETANNGAEAQEETLLEFPCNFAIKVFGRKAEGFADTMLKLVNELSDAKESATLQTRPSKNGKYEALTITLIASSKAELDRIYRALSSHDDVVMAL